MLKRSGAYEPGQASGASRGRGLVIQDGGLQRCAGNRLLTMGLAFKQGYLPYLSALSLELGTQGSCSAQLLFQLSRALSVARITLLQLPHLPPELPQLTQAATAAVQSGLQLPCTFRGLPDKGIGSGNFRG